MQECHKYEWIIFTSPNGVEAFFEMYYKLYKDARDMGPAKLVAIGPGTAKKIAEYRLSVDFLPQKSVAESLVEEFIEHAGSIDNQTILWVRGDAGLLGALERSIAIVGARAATGYGEHVTIEASSGLVDRGFAIVSGAAFGIDGAAHRAALASGGATVAFLAGGVDRFYPSAHETLLTRIVDRGAVVSEVPCGVAPTKWRFLQRNRLIAAASRATVVVEAGWRSGSLNTAGHAAQLGRPLGAVPGPVTSSASAGCHRLIREYDAVCVTSAQEMAELVDPESATRPRTGESSPERTRVLDALSRTGQDVARLAAISGMSVDAVRAELGMLELDGLAVQGPTGWRSSRPPT